MVSVRFIDTEEARASIAEYQEGLFTLLGIPGKGIRKGSDSTGEVCSLGSALRPHGGIRIGVF
ncbi:MAG: hypothetical protein KAU41_07715 [Deltaproteobacteria bacterium]|nr:hypothetical protein [Deltaproteobacteria bacterium]